MSLLGQNTVSHLWFFLIYLISNILPILSFYFWNMCWKWPLLLYSTITLQSQFIKQLINVPASIPPEICLVTPSCYSGLYSDLPLSEKSALTMHLNHYRWPLVYTHIVAIPLLWFIFLVAFIFTWSFLLIYPFINLYAVSFIYHIPKMQTREIWDLPCAVHTYLQCLEHC